MAVSIPPLTYANFPEQDLSLRLFTLIPGRTHLKRSKMYSSMIDYNCEELK